ncbi:MAG: histidine phosphatase family protein [Acidimicrobiales bacterium]
MPSEQVATPSGRRVLVVRHRESTWNAAKRWAGQADPPLSVAGRADAEVMAEFIAPFGFATIVSSDLERAVQTADVVAARLSDAVRYQDSRLREHDVPAWEGLTRDELESGWPGLYAAWKQGETNDLPGAEPWPVMETRILAGLCDAADRPGPVLVVVHQGVFRVLREALGVERPSRSRGVWLEPDASGALRTTGTARLRPAGEVPGGE